MQLQFVYGNPINPSKRPKKPKRRLASKRKRKKNKNKEEVVVAKKRKKAKKAHKMKKARKASSRRRVKKSKATKRPKMKARKKSTSKGRKKNPERYKLTFKQKVGVDKKGRGKYKKVQVRRSQLVATRGELQTLGGTARIAKEKSLKYPKRSRSRKAYAAAHKRLTRSLGKKRSARKAVSDHIKTARLSAKEANLKLQVKTERFPVVKKRKGKKKKSASRSRRSKAGRKTRRNPFFGGNMQDTIKKAVTGGMDKAELGALVLGGALYPVMTAGVARFLPGVFTQLQKLKIPGGAGVGANFLLGAIVYAVGDRMNNNIAKAAGKGLIASAAVGAAAVAGGMVAQRVLPAPATPTVGEIPYGNLPEGLYGYGADGDGVDVADFGEGGDADFGGVDYTMEGVDYTMEGVDYTMEGDAQLGEGGDADFGNIPEGMGEGQLG